LQVYFGLLIFLGYMVYDTQEIIERAHHGDMDYIKHALTLFTDFVAVLVRILVIMVSSACDGLPAGQGCTPRAVIMVSSPRHHGERHGLPGQREIMPSLINWWSLYMISLCCRGW